MTSAGTLATKYIVAVTASSCSQKLCGSSPRIGSIPGPPGRPPTATAPPPSLNPAEPLV